MTKKTIRRMCVVAGMLVGSVAAQAFVFDTQIMIDRALNSPTLTVRYKGAHAALVELRVNGDSLGTRTVAATKDNGETNFTLNLVELKEGDNDVEIRLFDRTGKLVGSDHTNISTEQTLNAPVYLTTPKIGQTVMGPVTIKMGFGAQLKDVFVSFFVDNDFKSMTNFPPYEYTWDTTRATNGWHELEAWAVDGASSTYKSKKVRVLVNNPGGHTQRTGVDSDATPSTNPQSVSIGSESFGLRPVQKPSQLAAGNQSVVLAPGIRGGATVENPHPFDISDTASGEKPVAFGHPVSTGLRTLVPTGRRMAVTAANAEAANASLPAVSLTHPSISGPIGPVARVTHISSPAKLVRTANTTKVAMVPHAQRVDVGEIEIRSTVDPSTVALGPKTVTIPPGSIYSNLATASSLLPITRGQHIPNLGSFAVVLNSQFVDFDVPTRVDGGVPMAPFRHLIEKAGGVVNWANSTKTVTANSVGQNISLQIGDKHARINDASISLELAPYIDRGRTIVPISFMHDALKVDVEYDKTTGHVLMTSVKN